MPSRAQVVRIAVCLAAGGAMLGCASAPSVNHGYAVATSNAPFGGTGYNTVDEERWQEEAAFEAEAKREKASSTDGGTAMQK